MPGPSKIRLTDRQKQICYGTVIGDASVDMNGKLNARLQMHHSLKQEEYIHWKRMELDSICTQKALSKVPVGKGSFSNDKYKLRLQTRNSPDITEIHNMLKPGGRKKTVTKQFINLLQPLGIVVWYCDDGGLTGNRRQIQFNTHNMTKTEVNTIRAYLRRNWGIKSKRQQKQSPVTPGKIYYFIAIYGEHAQNLLRLIVPLMPIKSMLYKTFLEFISKDTTERWNSYLETQYVPKFFESKEEFRAFLEMEKQKKT